MNVLKNFTWTCTKRIFINFSLSFSLLNNYRSVENWRWSPRRDETRFRVDKDVLNGAWGGGGGWREGEKGKKEASTDSTNSGSVGNRPGYKAGDHEHLRHQLLNSTPPWLCVTHVTTAQHEGKPERAFPHRHDSLLPSIHSDTNSDSVSFPVSWHAFRFRFDINTIVRVIFRLRLRTLLVCSSVFSFFLY